MNSYPINSGAINAAMRFAAIVYLPSAAVNIELGLSERSYVSMSGYTGMDRSLNGDISKVANLGVANGSLTVHLDGELTRLRRSYLDVANVGITFTSIGDLTQFRKLYIGEANTGLSFNFSGLLQTTVAIPSSETVTTFTSEGTTTRLRVIKAAIEYGFDLTGRLVSFNTLGNLTFGFGMDVVGAMRATRYLNAQINKQFLPTAALSVGVRSAIGSGSTLFAMKPSGELHRTARMAGGIAMSFHPVAILSKGVRIPMYAVPLAITIDAQGKLRQTIRFSGIIEPEITTVASMVTIRTLQGTGSKQVGLTGDLANNANSSDLPMYLMVRRPINREMLR